MDGALAGAAEGFIWMILRVRVGGGGRSNGSAPLALDSAVDVRFLPVEARGLAGGAGCGLDMGECGWYEDEDEAADVLEGRESKVRAGGGSSKDICEEMKREPSRLLRSVEEEGVGGAVGRGILDRIESEGYKLGCLVLGRGKRSRAQQATDRLDR